MGESPIVPGNVLEPSFCYSWLLFSSHLGFLSFVIAFSKNHSTPLFALIFSLLQFLLPIILIFLKNNNKVLVAEWV